MEGAWDRPRDQIVHPFYSISPPVWGRRLTRRYPRRPVLNDRTGLTLYTPGKRRIVRQPTFTTGKVLATERARASADAYPLSEMHMRLNRTPHQNCLGGEATVKSKKARPSIARPSPISSRELVLYFATKLRVTSPWRVNVEDDFVNVYPLAETLTVYASPVSNSVKL